MTPERWAEVREVFEAAADLDVQAAADLLDGRCAGDRELRAEVERLLAADRAAGGFLGTPPWEHLAAVLPPAAPPEPATAGGFPGGDGAAGGLPAGGWIGPYRIEREIGQGGMGAVYLAERADGWFDKQVAIKRVRGGLDTADMLRRFRLEQRILARLEHPGIARLYDAGADEAGRPYFVMEHVPGVPIDRWCEERGLAVEERLELFRQVCAAVHHAHQNLVAHRDLKPSNILVTPDGAPKLLDFGIAKLLEPDAAEQAEATRTVFRVLTPEYASPEQFRGEPVTTATDVYSLGVLLYVLLTGRRPYRLAGRSPGEIERAVCEEEPPRPSTAALREKGGRLRRRLAGDLDNIVLRALQKDPRRRYASVDQLAEDIGRHLAGQPVAARGDGFWYRAAKLVRRHKAAAAALAAIVVFGAAMAVLALRTARALDETTAALARADREARKAADVTAFLVDLFRRTDPREAGGQAVTAREILERGARRVEVELAAEPEARAAVLGAIGNVYFNLGLPVEAEPVLQKALAVRRQVLGLRHPEVATSLDDLARALRDRGDLARAEPLARQALELRLELLGGGHPDVATSLNNLGLLLYRKGDYPAAETALQEALSIRRGRAGVPADARAESLVNLAVVVQVSGRYAEAEPLYREAVALYRQQYGPDHPSVATTLNNLALVVNRKGDKAEAERLLRQALLLHRRGLGEDHPAVADTRANLAGLLTERGDFAAAEPFAREALAAYRRGLGERHPKLVGSLNTLGFLLHAKGDPAAAEPQFREALALGRELLPPGHPDLSGSLVGLGAVLIDRGRARQAEPLLREGLAIRRQALPAGHWRIAAAESELGGCLAALGSGPEAGALLAASLPVLAKELGPLHRQTRRAAAYEAALKNPSP